MIKAGSHKEFDGVVHGRSSSGSTYFIEPFTLVEINNKLAILKRDELAEEIRILKAATALVLESKGPLLADMDGVGYLDTVQARACFSQELKAVAPVFKTTGGVRLRKARHPILALKELAGAGRAVPIDIIIHENCKVLVISGANTGGKTVALKTLGLLTLMALSAIPIPAGDGSEVFFFNSVFADIGDRQDIIANLSTFSAHIKRIHGFLNMAGPGALVLIDEIGVGTDPAEGGAIALAALETFKERGAISVVTTHLNLLKAHAQVAPGYENASVEFGEETLKPLYNLRLGVPGPSLGLSIARGLGMDPELIERAGGYLKEDEGAFIESVRALEEERAELAMVIERSKALEEKRAEAVRRLRDKRGVLLGKVKGKLEAVIEEAAGEIKLVLAELKAGRAGPRASTAAERIEEISSRAARRLQKTEPYVPRVGDRVTIIGSSTKGVVAGVDRTGERAELSVGSLTVWVDWKKLRSSSGPSPGKYQEARINADIEVSTSVKLIGMRAAEAVKVLARFLDNAHANGLERVEVIHGVGTGRLAGAVKGFLDESELVKRFYHEDPARGGGGVTVVELK
jgi:DNA mismatch repair protein MutS2